MNKYGVSKEIINECEECGEKLIKISGKLVCLFCEQEKTFGVESKQKTTKQSQAQWK